MKNKPAKICIGAALAAAVILCSGYLPSAETYRAYAESAASASAEVKSSTDGFEQSETYAVIKNMLKSMFSNSAVMEYDSESSMLNVYVTAPKNTEWYYFESDFPSANSNWQRATKTYDQLSEIIGEEIAEGGYNIECRVIELGDEDHEHVLYTAVNGECESDSLGVRTPTYGVPKVEKEPESTPSPTPRKRSSHKTYNTDDPSNYLDAEEFYYWNWDDFIDYEDAEDYFNEHS